MEVNFPNSMHKNKVSASIIAVAKDEGAYLAEWVFHHLYFGFSEIHILINRTADTSGDILDCIKKKHGNVYYHVVDDIINGFINKSSSLSQVQSKLYLMWYRKKIIKNDYALIVDIDEFWTPLDFETDISQFIIGLSSPPVLSFEWACKLNESLFSRPYQQINELSRNIHVKSMFNTSLSVKKIGPHHIESDSTFQVMANGHQMDMGPHVQSSEMEGPLKRAFILHRLWRSQPEYIAHSFKSNPLAEGKFLSHNGIVMKGNRRGYHVPKQFTTYFNILQDNLDDYENRYNVFLDNTGIRELIVESQKMVVDRFNKGVKFIQSYSAENSQVKDFSRNVDLEKAKIDISNFTKAHN
ncbi:MAG: glycosyltransferase family 2 protein [Cyclobacteriaceae bacterium]